MSLILISSAQTLTIAIGTIKPRAHIKIYAARRKPNASKKSTFPGRLEQKTKKKREKNDFYAIGTIVFYDKLYKTVYGFLVFVVARVGTRRECKNNNATNPKRRTGASIIRVDRTNVCGRNVRNTKNTCGKRRWTVGGCVLL